MTIENYEKQSDKLTQPLAAREPYGELRVPLNVTRALIDDLQSGQVINIKYDGTIWAVIGISPVNHYNGSPPYGVLRLAPAGYATADKEIDITEDVDDWLKNLGVNE